MYVSCYIEITKELIFFYSYPTKSSPNKFYYKVKPNHSFQNVIMKKSTNTTLITLFLFFAFASNIFAQNFAKSDWKLKTEKGNLKVFTRDNSESEVKEIRIQTSVNAPIEKVLAVLNDVSNYKNWVYKSIDSKKVKIISKNEYYYYSLSDFPFPIADRDLVIHSRQWKDEKTGIYHSQSKAISDSNVELKKGIIRITEFDSHWKIIPQADGTVAIDYVALTHPGGKLPVWVVNLGITKGPVETMKKFAFLLEDDNSTVSSELK